MNACTQLVPLHAGPSPHRPPKQLLPTIPHSLAPCKHGLRSYHIKWPQGLEEQGHPHSQTTTWNVSFLVQGQGSFHNEETKSLQLEGFESDMRRNFLKILGGVGEGDQESSTRERALAAGLRALGSVEHNSVSTYKAASESKGPTRWRVLEHKSHSFWIVSRMQGILQGPQGGPPPPLGSARPSRQPQAWVRTDASPPHTIPSLPQAACRPPARASRGALSQAGTLIKTGAIPPSPVTPRYPHKLHFICFLFTVSLLIKSVIACLRGHGPRFPTQRDLRVCAHGCGCVHMGLSSRPFPGREAGVLAQVCLTVNACVCMWSWIPAGTAQLRWGSPLGS